jgi:hypothetical protein
MKKHITGILGVLAFLAILGFVTPTNAPLHVQTNADLKKLSTLASPVVFRDDGGAAVYTKSNVSCVSADDGAQVTSGDGKCWIADFSVMRATPKVWGCAGNGTTNDAVCLQASVTAVGGKPLYSGPYKYRSNSPITSATSGFEFVCDDKAYGLVSGVANQNLLTLSGSNQAILNCGIDMRNNGAFANTSGAAIVSSGANVVIEANILGPCLGIDISGNVGTIHKSRITFADVNNNGCSGIRVGHTTTLATTVDIRIQQTITECPVCATPAEEGLLVEDAGGLFITESDFLTTKHGVHIAPGANQQVIWLTAHNTYLSDGTTIEGLLIDALAATSKVAGLSFSQTWTSSSVGGAGVYIANSGGGTVDDIRFDLHRIFANGGHGLVITGGSNVSVTNTDICGNGTLTANTYDGVVVQAGIGKVMLQGNRIRSACGSVSNQQFAGIAFLGAGDDVLVQNNDLRGNQTSGLTLAGTLTNSRVEGNAGYNPVGTANITVGASPFTYSAGPSPETIYILAGTVSSVSTGGIVTCISTNCSVNLGPNESLTVTYSVLPCLLTSHFWAEAISVLSVVAQLVATLTGAAIGIITLYRMWKHRTMRADVHLLEAYPHRRPMTKLTKPTSSDGKSPVDFLKEALDDYDFTDDERAMVAGICMGESKMFGHSETGYAHTNNDRIRRVFGERVSRTSAMPS